MKLTFPIPALKRTLEEHDRCIAQGSKALTTYGEETGPGFWLVADQGVYLMTNMDRQVQTSAKVTYAEESNPEKMAFDDWWHARGEVFGGDDGVEFIDSSVVDMVRKAETGTLSLTINADSIRAILIP